MIEDSVWLDRIVRNALEEDLGAQDLTTWATVPPEARGEAVLLARETFVLAGIGVFLRAFELLSSDIHSELRFQDGDTVPAGERICSVSGPTCVLLQAERTALNFLQRMSGIATLTRSFVDRVRPYKAKILDTRKTAPGLRFLDKYSVRMGGGMNHRMGLYDGILIKDNHIAAAGSISRAVALARQKVPHTLKVEVEVEDLAGLEKAIEAGADVILLDNMSPSEMKEAVRVTGGKVLLEASGNVRLENVEEIARTGVDMISVGALTHSPRAVDVSLELR